MSKYVFVTFAPIQSFIEKSRKLRDLYGASLILSYLSTQLLKAAKTGGAEVVSPGLPGFSKGMPNRILVKGHFPSQTASNALIAAWGQVLEQCRTWLETQVEDLFNLPNIEQLVKSLELKNQPETIQTWNLWKTEWHKWKNYTWELFWGTGATPDEARQDLETRKLSRRWTAINWIGESSSISGSDAIAYPRLEAKDLNLKQGFPISEKSIIDDFYKTLAWMFDHHHRDWSKLMENSEIEGKFIDENERLSIPELVKRLVTYPQIADALGIEYPPKFREMVRQIPKGNGTTETPDLKGHWTGWFMGDGDRLGKHLRTLANKGDDKIYRFSEIIRTWGKDFQKEFPPELGGIVYAGGDDFLGIIYSSEYESPIPGYRAFEQLIKLNESWNTIQPQVKPLVNQPVTVSVGFVWAGPGVPQRDVLQHCREAQKEAKKRDRDRVTIRIVFNNSQYIEWTTPWQYLNILNHYRDLDGQSNWSHVYSDLAQLKSRHALGFGIDQIDRQLEPSELKDCCQGALEFLELYFPSQGKRVKKNQRQIFQFLETQLERNREIILWIEGLIEIGWHLLGDRLE